MIEREQKFFLKKNSIDFNTLPVKYIRQGYLFSPKGKHLRIRILDDGKSYLTIKHSIKNSDDRFEFEYEIPLKDANELMELCSYKLQKARYLYSNDSDREIIIDVYPAYYKNGRNLEIVEVEYKDQIGDIPNICGKNISNKKGYGNLSIAKKITRKNRK